MLKRNRITKESSSLEPKVMLAAAAEPATLDLGTGVGTAAQGVTEASAILGVETSVAVTADGSIDTDSAQTGDADSVALAVPEAGGASVHSHSQVVVSPDGESTSLVFADSSGQSPGIPEDSVVLSQPTSGVDAVTGNITGSPVVAASGEDTFVHVPSEEGTRTTQTDLDSQEDLEVLQEQITVIGNQNLETATKRGLAEADRTAGDGNGTLTEEQVQANLNNASAKQSEALGGTLFVGENDGSGQFTELPSDPAIS